MTYCIEVRRELEDKEVHFHNWDTPPTKEQVREVVGKIYDNFHDGYDEFKYYPVPSKIQEF